MYGTPCEFGSGERLFGQGERADTLFVLEQGCVSIQVDADEIDSDHVLADLEAPAIIGEHAFFGETIRSASVYADTSVQGQLLTQDGFLRLQAEQPQVAMRFLQKLGQVLAERLRITNQRLAESLASTTLPPGIEGALESGQQAATAIAGYSQTRRNAMAYDLAHAIAQQAEDLAAACVQITGMGNQADRKEKILWSSLGILPTLEPEAAQGMRRRPAGLVFAVLPLTSPVSTATFKLLIALAAGNAIAFNFHRRAAELGARFMAIVGAVLARHRAPDGLVSVLPRASRATTAVDHGAPSREPDSCYGRTECGAGCLQFRDARDWGWRRQYAGLDLRRR